MTDAHGAARLTQLSVDLSSVHGIRIVSLRGEVDHQVRDLFRDALFASDGAGPPRTVADFAGVTFMDSSGINVLIAAHRAAQDAQGWLRVAGAQESVLRVMQVVGIDTLIACYPDITDAMGN